MKKFLSVVFTIALMLNIISVLPVNAKALGNIIYSYEFLDDGSIEITNYTGNETNITIPDTIDGYKVTKIGYCAFTEIENAVYVTIPNGVTVIDAGAFSFCENLEEVYISKSVRYIEYGAFLHCPKLKNVILSKNVTKIDLYAFGYYTNYIEETGRYVLVNTPMSDFSITGFKNCTAQAYAGGCKIKYNILTCYGDANGDGKVDILDATEIQKHLVQIAELDKASRYLSDVNNDGNVDILDATEIQKFLVELVSVLG